MDGLERVSDLIIPNTNIWNKSLIESNFLEEEDRKIVSIPILNSICSDKLVWFKEKLGIYLAKGECMFLLAPSDIGEIHKSNCKFIYHALVKLGFYYGDL